MKQEKDKVTKILVDDRKKLYKIIAEQQKEIRNNQCRLDDLNCEIIYLREQLKRSK